MKWTELIDAVASRGDIPRRDARRVLEAFADETLEALRRGDDVVIRRLGSFSSQLVAPRIIRSISDNRKMRLGERSVVRFRPAKAARDAAAARVPQHWKDQKHQTAWRIAETLVGDLHLYHAARAPELNDGDSDEETHRRCVESFGSLWSQVKQSYEGQVDTDVRQSADYLTAAARRRWSG